METRFKRKKGVLLPYLAKVEGIILLSDTDGSSVSGLFLSHNRSLSWFFVMIWFLSQTVIFNEIIEFTWCIRFWGLRNIKSPHLLTLFTHSDLPRFLYVPVAGSNTVSRRMESVTSSDRAAWWITSLQSPDTEWSFS